MRRVKLLPSLALAALLSACGDDTPPAAPATCMPACSSGYACVSGTCEPACNPACAPGQSCRVRNGAATCEGPGADASPADVADDLAADVPLTDAQPDAPATDAPATDAPATDATATDTPAADAPATDAATTDTPTADAPAMDAPRDVAAADTAPADAPRDVAAADMATADAPRDVSAMDAADAALPPCGAVGQVCCGGRACAAGAVCSTVGMTTRCDAITPVMDECTTTLRCATGRVCGGVFFCATRHCMLCVAPGATANGMPCSTFDQCASSICANSTCAPPCLLGPEGAASCRALNPQWICAQFTASRTVDGGTTPRLAFGACVPGCARDRDCRTGTTCRLQRNDLEDRLDLTCSPPFGTIPPGGACDPMAPSNAPAASFCSSSQCIATGDRTGYCSTFCAADADCPANYACVAYTFGRPSGRPQEIRMCARR